MFLNGLGQWAIPTDVYATWGNIGGTLSNQADLMALLNAKAPINNPTFTGLVQAPTPPVDDNTTKVATTAWFFGQAFNAVPQMDGVGSSGASPRWARGDHRHPTDTSLAALAGATFTGPVNVPNVIYPNDSTLAANTHYVSQAIFGQAFNGVPQMDGIGSSGDSTLWARGNHVHPTDTTRAPIDTPNFIGLPTAPTPAYPNNSQRIATTGLSYSAAAGLIFSQAGSNRLSITSSINASVPVVLPADPTLPLQAATKQYVDNHSVDTSGFVQKAGDTMTGPLGLSVGSASAPSLFFAGNPTYGFYQPSPGRRSYAAGGIEIERLGANNPALTNMVYAPQTAGTSQFTFRRDAPGTLNTKLLVLANDTASNSVFVQNQGVGTTPEGVLKLIAGSTVINSAVNGDIATFTGSTKTSSFAGPVMLAADPVVALEAATKQYVDAHAGGINPPPSDGNTYGYKNGAWVILDLATKWDKA